MKYYITTAIDYVNSLPHIGTAYEKIGADVLARWLKLKGADVRFQMGVDVHSTNVIKAAEKHGKSFADYCNDMSKQFEKTWIKLDISHDDFIQTNEQRQHDAVNEIFKRIKDNGFIYKAHYKGLYCESCEAYITEKDLVDGMCPSHKQKPTELSEENYFFALSKFTDKLKKHIEKNPEFILPKIRRNEIMSVLNEGLEDISISRQGVEWGIPVPDDETQKIYVWFDALTNYIAAVGYPKDEKLYKKWWPASLHVIGKDITRFHCLLWPAMLMAADIPLPKTVFGHGFVSFKGEKMSKSLGNVVTPLEVINKYGADPLRYYLMREGSFGRDSDFTWEGFISRYNGDLANGVGNITSRTAGMISKYCDGKLKRDDKNFKKLFGKQFDEIYSNVEKNLDWMNGEIAFHQVLAGIWEGMAIIDKYINDSKPWVLAKEKKQDEIEEVLQTVMEALGRICVLIAPFVPTTANKMWKSLGWSKWDDLNSLTISNKSWIPEESGTFEVEQIALFPRIEEEKKEEPKKDNNKNKEKKMTEGLLDISDFAKIEFRIAKIIEAEKVEGADKLLKIQVDLEDEKRQIVAGIAKKYSPEELIGKLIVVVANLKPAKLRGVESQGMLLAASKGDELVLVTPEKEISIGAKVK